MVHVGASAATANNRLTLVRQWLSAPKQQIPTPAMTADAEVLSRKNGAVQTIVLNRPKKLNALNMNMVRLLIPELQASEASDATKIIVIKSSGGKGFCAGGDVRTVVELAEQGDPNATLFFQEEYQLDHLIGTLETPYISLMDGITMGGGVGLSVHAPFRVATENTLFAMPETGIGFLPEVAGSFFLPRLDGQLGIYLGLTGKRLKGVDVFYAGVATHYVPSARLPSLEARLAELQEPTLDAINAVIEEFSAAMEQEAPFSLGGDVRAAIDRCFKHETVEEIVAAVQKEDSEWAKDTLKLLGNVSPTSLKITLLQLRTGATLSLGECFKLEYHLVQKFLEGHDFKEGVTATLVTRTAPKWKPATLEEVDLAKIKKAYFDSPSSLQMEMLNKKDYMEYPHRKYALPSEKDVERMVTAKGLSRDEVVDYFVRERNGKQGVKAKVTDILNRKTQTVGKNLAWIN